MSKDELIKRLKQDLANMMDWAREVSDQYLDGDPDTRKAFVADMESASEAYRMEALEDG